MFLNTIIALFSGTMLPTWWVWMSFTFASIGKFQASKRPTAWVYQDPQLPRVFFWSAVWDFVIFLISFTVFAGAIWWGIERGARWIFLISLLGIPFGVRGAMAAIRHRAETGQ